MPYASPVNLGDVDMAHAPEEPRKRLRDETLKKVDTLMKRHGGVGPRWSRWATGPLARWAVKKAVKTKLNGVLQL